MKDRIIIVTFVAALVLILAIFVGLMTHDEPRGPVVGRGIREAIIVNETGEKIRDLYVNWTRPIYLDAGRGAGAQKPRSR